MEGILTDDTTVDVDPLQRSSSVDLLQSPIHSGNYTSPRGPKEEGNSSGGIDDVCLSSCQSQGSVPGGGVPTICPGRQVGSALLKPSTVQTGTAIIAIPDI